ncbi:unnamed protein product [Nezara viridula]|uniref:Uncharacterized protein n=1 Tax=Nezara viridula TaxID=85310 RepID=A0A9P0MQ03_NEZVI|nr:unnamed protein product [Nezara viridula]
MYGENRGVILLFRLGLFVGLLTAVVTVIYLTPIPGEYPSYLCVSLVSIWSGDLTLCPGLISYLTLLLRQDLDR